MVISCAVLPVAFAQGEELRDHPYNCGLYCLHAAFEFLGKQVEPDLLMKAEYVSAPRGSAIADLVHAAGDFGFSAVPLTGLTVGFVKHAKYPIILSVRSKPSVPDADHYWVVLPAKNGDAHLVDAMYGQTEEWGSLSRGQWSGVGVVISQQPLSLASIYGGHFAFVAVVCAAALAAGALLRILFSGRRPSKQRTSNLMQHLAMSCATVGGACLLSFAYHVSTADGSFINDEEAVRAVQLRHIGSILPTRTAEDLAGTSGNAPILVDARWQAQYVAGHIGDALNLPPDVTTTQFAETVEGIDPGKEVIVYCDNVRCAYAGMIAGKFWEAGYRNIGIYRGGWRDWQEQSGETQR